MIMQKETSIVVTVLPCLFFLHHLPTAQRGPPHSLHALHCPLQVYFGDVLKLIAPHPVESGVGELSVLI